MFIVIKNFVLPVRKCGLSTFYGYNLNDFIIYLTRGISGAYKIVKDS